MKKSLLALVALGMLACTVEKKPGQDEVLATAIKLNKNEITLEIGADEALTVTYTPANVTKKDLVWSSSDTGIATVTDGVVVAVNAGNAEIIVKCGNATDRCKVNVITPAPVCPAGAEDLGIVMTRGDGTTYTLYWAKSNLGEEGLCPNPEDYGDYYAWGELEPHYLKGHSLDVVCNDDWRIIDGKQMTGYNWPSYKWCKGNYNKLTKYCTSSETGLWSGPGAPDDITELITGPDGDDIASKMLGGKWRIPTDAEWKELLIKCTWTWTADYNGTGVPGCIVTSNVSGYTDKSIFLPAAGGRSNLGLYDAASDGSYWSSSVNIDIPDNAWNIYLTSSFIDMFFTGRCYGLSLRPVSE